jgi:hypothetical protein
MALTHERKSELTDAFTSLIGNCIDNYAMRNSWFPELPPMSIDIAAQDIHEGIDIIFCKPKHEDVRRQMHELFEKIHLAFQEGRFDDGFALCHPMHDLFAKTKVR